MIKYYRDMIQGTEEWYAARCGLLTASEMKHIITPAKLQYAQNDKERTHLYELTAQRITKYVEPHYISDDMLRGRDDEVDAKVAYEKHYAPVQDVGFVTNDKWGFTLGYSPDGLVGDDGQIECKGRRQKFQIETIIKYQMPEEYLIQVQTGLMVSERNWTDFLSYCGGMPMVPLRIFPDLKVQDAIAAASAIFHEKLDKMLKAYADRLVEMGARLVPTERRIEQEITI
jgi:predicted phage-related endonuclease